MIYHPLTVRPDDFFSQNFQPNENTHRNYQLSICSLYTITTTIK